MSIPNPEVGNQSLSKRNSPLLFLAGLAVVIGIIVSLLLQEPRAVESAGEGGLDEGMATAPELPLEGYSESRGAPVTIDRVDRTLDQGERSQWAEDPSSYGFNDDDRAFLSEHGVSESEARAMETILRESGVE